MSIIDFTEIAKGNEATGNQDKFELFARDFLELVGYEIVSDPDRGADGGKDLIVSEKRRGIGGESQINWLVSCKHKAHSGRSVTPSIETNIRDRVESNNCTGFIGFYSTISSSGLSNNLTGLKNKIETQQYDSEKIEKKLLSTKLGVELAERFFPLSIEKWKNASVPFHAIKSAQNISRKWSSIIRNDIFKDKNVMSQQEFFKKAEEFIPHISLKDCEDIKTFLFWAIENETVIFRAVPIEGSSNDITFVVHLNVNSGRIK